MLSGISSVSPCKTIIRQFFNQKNQSYLNKKVGSNQNEIVNLKAIRTYSTYKIQNAFSKTEDIFDVNCIYKNKKSALRIVDIRKVPKNHLLMKLESSRDMDISFIDLEVRLKSEVAKTSLLLPTPDELKGINILEKKGLKWAKKNRLYEKKELIALKNTFVGALTGFAYSPLVEETGEGHELLVIADKCLRHLFKSDDWADGNEIKSDVWRKNRIRIENILNGDETVNDSDMAVTKIIVEIFNETDQFKRYPKLKNYLFEYLQHSEAEIRTKEKGELYFIEDKTESFFRIYTSGGMYSIGIGAALSNINLENFLHKSSVLPTMTKIVCLCAGTSNSVVSSPKEEKYEPTSLNPILVNIKEKKESVSTSVNRIAEEHNNLMIDYFKLSTIFHDELKNEDEQTKKEGLKIDKFMQGWLKSWIWGIFSKRYNMVETGSEQDINRLLREIKNQKKDT